MISEKHRKHFSRDPEIMSGALVFAGTRVPVKNLFDYLAGGDDLEEFFDGFPGVSHEQVQAALASALDLLEAEYPEAKKASA